MRKFVLVFGIVLAAGPLFAADQTWTGVITDSMCGADHSKMGSKMSAKDCTLACTKAGASYAIVSDGKVYKLTGKDGDLKAHAGDTVTIAGEIKGNVIKVTSVTAAQK